jgi:hypothetical protein
MRRSIAWILGAVVGAVAIVGLADATQNRPDVIVPGSSTSIRFTVETHRFARGDAAAADTIWAVCIATVGHAVATMPEPVGDAWEVEVTPALGEHSRRRLVGCLEDATVDRVLANVIAFESTS